MNIAIVSIAEFCGLGCQNGRNIYIDEGSTGGNAFIFTYSVELLNNDACANNETA